MTAVTAAVALSQLGSHPISECMASMNSSLPSDIALPQVLDFRVQPGKPWLERPATNLLDD